MLVCEFAKASARRLRHERLKLGPVFFNFSVTAADSRVCHQPDCVAQISSTKQGQSIRQPPKQIGAVWFAQSNYNRPAVPREGERNRVEEILVGGDENRAVRLRAFK